MDPMRVGTRGNGGSSVDGSAPVLAGVAGTAVLVFLVPMAVAVSVGVLVRGVVGRRWGRVLAALALPIAVWVLGSALRDAALQSPAAPSDLEGSLRDILALAPLGVLLAVAVFVVGIMPKLVGVARR